jgi:hypothetical protein
MKTKFIAVIYNVLYFNIKLLPEKLLKWACPVGSDGKRNDSNNK